MKNLLALLLISLAAPAFASNKGIVEGVPSTFKGIFVDTVGARVDFSTTGYGGGISNVGLVVSSNVVISSPTSANNVVIYATGTIVANGTILGTVFASTCTSVSFRGQGDQSVTSASWVAIGNSTLTFTTSGNRILANFTCPCHLTNNNAQNGKIGLLVDGGYIDGESDTQGFMALVNNAVTAPTNCNFTHLSENTVSAASHGFSLVTQASSAADPLVIEFSNAKCQFCVQEAK